MDLRHLFLVLMAAAVKGIDLWSQRAEIAAIHEELPWKDLLGDMGVDAILDRDKADLVKYLRAAGSSALLLTSVQVDTACGRLGQRGTYVGAEQDFADFPFTEVLGLSSYPYFAYAQPEEIPDTCFSRVLNGRSQPAILSLFTRIGLVDADFRPKPALVEWDRLHRRRSAP